MTIYGPRNSMQYKQVRVCQRVVDPGGGEGDQGDVVGVAGGHPGCSRLGVRAAFHSLQLRHNRRSENL